MTSDRTPPQSAAKEMQMYDHCTVEAIADWIPSRFGLTCSAGHILGELLFSEPFVPCIALMQIERHRLDASDEAVAEYYSSLGYHPED